MKKFFKFIQTSKFYNFMFWFCIIFMIIDVVNAGMMFNLGETKQGWSNVVWATLMAVCAWYNSRAAKTAEQREKEEKDHGQDIKGH